MRVFYIKKPAKLKEAALPVNKITDFKLSDY